MRSRRERCPTSWETNAGGPFLTLEREQGTVEAWDTGPERFTIRDPEIELHVQGPEEARFLARTLAAMLE